MSPRWESNPDMRTGRHVTYHLHAHLVFVTKHRKVIFDDAMLKRCEEIMREVRTSFETELREFNGERDHVHLLVHYPPKIALSKLSTPSRASAPATCEPSTPNASTASAWGSVFWFRSYFAGSCGGAPISIVRQYIESQKRPVCPSPREP
ncbi:IS200/IS605 family transposase [Streptomyces sp. NPDC051896]|uniref:IS200/IS605 family transposase n=1 Tax=Streptomyces sp. NPDC051896 TaxID=3155416 RepID=UPI00341E0052